MNYATVAMATRLLTRFFRSRISSERERIKTRESLANKKAKLRFEFDTKQLDLRKGVHFKLKLQAINSVQNKQIVYAKAQDILGISHHPPKKLLAQYFKCRIEHE